MADDDKQELSGPLSKFFESMVPTIDNSYCPGCVLIGSIGGHCADYRPAAHKYVNKEGAVSRLLISALIELICRLFPGTTKVVLISKLVESQILDIDAMAQLTH